MKKRPRWFKPDTFYQQSQKTVDGQFLFAIIPEVHNAISATAVRVLLNSVKHILVEQVEQWQGFSSDSQCARGMDKVYPHHDRTAYHTYRRHPDAKQLAVFLMIRLYFSRLPHGRTIHDSYDLPGRRIAKRINGKQTEAMLYLDMLRPAAKLDASGTVVQQYVYATGINSPDAMIQDGMTYALIRDHIGSVRLVVDADSGEVAQRMDYDEFGLERIEDAPTRFTTWSRDSVIAAKAAIQIEQNWIAAFAEMTDGTSLIR